MNYYCVDCYPGDKNCFECNGPFSYNTDELFTESGRYYHQSCFITRSDLRDLIRNIPEKCVKCHVRTRWGSYYEEINYELADAVRRFE